MERQKRIMGVRWAASIVLVLCFAGAVSSRDVLQQNDTDETRTLQGEVVREVLAGRQVYEYRSYKDVQIFHFSIPPLVSHAVFNFTANDTRSCNARNITTIMQADSYPVINPDGAEFPEGLWINRTQMYETTLKSDLKPVLLTVEFPQAGDWYMLVFINDTSNRITQAGLFPSCHSWLQVKVEYHIQPQVSTIVPEIHSQNNIYLVQTVKDIQYHKFYVPTSTWMIVVNVTNCDIVDLKSNSSSTCPLELSVRALALPGPNTSNTDKQSCYHISPGEECILESVPVEEAWHYLSLTPKQELNDTLELVVSLKIIFISCTEESGNIYHLVSESPEPSCLASQSSEELNTPEILVSEENNGILEENSTLYDLQEVRGQQLTCWPKHRLEKKTFGGNYAFEYDVALDENGTSVLVLNITNDSPTVLSFELEHIIDIGGTLLIEIGVSPFMNTSNHNYSLVGCVSHRLRGEFDSNNSCVRGHRLESNTTGFGLFSSSVFIPYPEPGPWHLTLLPLCYTNNGSDYEYVDCTSEITSLLFGITSASCIQGKCGHYGSCFQYISGGFIFSTCVCDAGYRGWGCTDKHQALPDWELLLATLLLTLSNLFFLPAIFLALKRKYYAEALVYTFTMFFSTFYHACDQDAYSFCLMPLNTMQFCDFYSAIMSFWVTLIAMADLHHSVYSVLHMAGALVIALGVEYDRTGLWVFAIPASSAFIIMTVSWVWHCKKQHQCYPSKRYWLVCLIPGTILAVTGLICYAFLETLDNYHYIHSAWHATMALSILCILPPARKKDEFVGCDESQPLPGSEAQLLSPQEQNYSLLSQPGA
ncbi:unnamed protein product [Meganyctiphanes norvegica]|uniref:EGF-like domain-containing protein n=1 Tax=Meganyctiphanes norvegica TaxID=48144 RepID=A0AAV2Q219_MEGNR